jgi:hypothetical protein
MVGRFKDEYRALIVTRSVSEVGADSRLNSSLTLRVTMAAVRRFSQSYDQALSIELLTRCNSYLSLLFESGARSWLAKCVYSVAAAIVLVD